MIKFDIKSPQDKVGVVKASVHKNGKLGFSAGAAKLLDLDKDKRFYVATNAEDSEDKNLYLLEAKEIDEKSFKVNKAGQYYYMRIRHILDEMGVDYRQGGIIYDIVTVQQLDEEKYYKLIKRKATSRKE